MFGRDRTAVVVDDTRNVAGYRLARRAGARVRLVRGNEDVKELGRANAVDDVDAGCLFPQRARRRWQRFARGHALAELARAHGRAMGSQHAIRRRRDEDHRGAMRADGVEERVGRGLFDEQRRRADAHRKQQEPAEAESKRKRRTAAKDVVGACTQHVRRKALADRHHVAVKVHRRLGDTRRSRGEGEDAGVVRGRVDVPESLRLPRHRAFQAVAGGVVEHLDAKRRRLRDGSAQFVRKPRVAQRVRDLRLADDRRELLRAQERHRRDRDGTRLHYREPACGHHRAVGCAQEDAVARDHAHLALKHVGDAIGLRKKIGVRPARPFGCPYAGRTAAAFGHSPVEKLRRAIELRRECELRKIEQVFRLLLARRQVVARERVDVRRAHHAPPVLSDS